MFHLTCLSGFCCFLGETIFDRSASNITRDVGGSAQKRLTYEEAVDIAGNIKRDGVVVTLRCHFCVALKHYK